jgi:L-lysine exporter family protein LysE/ArgO
MAASLIVAIGPQNAYLLKYGLARHRFVFSVAAIYVAIDVVLITLGAVGFGSLIAQHPLLKLCFAVLAGVFFCAFGVSSIFKSLRSGKTEAPKVPGAAAYSTAILLSLANPGVLFDTIVIIGGFAGQYADIYERLAFSAGAALASFSWFAALACLAYFAGGYINDRVWKLVDLAIGILLIVLAATILRDAVTTAREIGWI